MKIAISVPDPIFEAADRLARERNVPRSRIISEALELYLEAQGPGAITARLNQVYEKEDSTLAPELAKAQAGSTSHETW